MMMPPLGKSGPGSTAKSSSTVGLGRRFFMTISMAAATSAKLWVGMLVAIPTAMPVVPLTSNPGIRPGKLMGSKDSPS